MSKYNKLEKYFNQLLTLDDESRTVFLQELRDNEPEVYQELLVLYGEHDEASQYFAQIEEKINDTLFEKEDRSGETFGNYQLEELIGSGGMANVYKAKRTDGTFQREAAIKFTKRGLDSENVLARFQYERKILGRLKHESIAQIYDAGMSEEGLPYFVMEYVDGTDIISYAKENNLNIRQCLNLFQQVCKAVEFAHKNLVIHRDIKPTNILIDRDEKVKLTDFGIAKILNPEEDSELTQLHTQVMTPGYASPEQRKGNFINTTSDVFQLGLLLYELVSGEKAYDKEKKEYQFNFGKKLVPSEIKSIIQTATREEPEERYNTAEALLQDISNYQESKPVSASGNHKWYVFRKFVARNKISVAFSFALFFILLFGIISINQQRKIALTEKEKAEEVTEYVKNLFLQNDPVNAKGDTLTAIDIIQAGITNINSLDKQSAVKAELNELVGEIYINLGEYDSAKGFLLNAYRIRKTNNHAAEELFSCYHGFANYLLHIGNYDSSLYYSDKSIKLLNEKNNYQDNKNTLVDLLRIKADAYQGLAQFEVAQENIQQALAIMDTTVASRRHGRLLIDLATNYHLMNKPHKALNTFDQALKVYHKFSNKDDIDLGSIYNERAIIYKNTGKYELAENEYLKAIDNYRSVYGLDHMQTSNSLVNYGLLCIKSYEFEKADSLIQLSINIIKNIFDHHPEIANRYANYAVLKIVERKYQEANEIIDKGIKEGKVVYSNEDVDLMASLYGLKGQCHQQFNELDSARFYSIKAYNTWKNIVGEQSRRCIGILSTIAKIEIEENNINKADSIYQYMFSNLLTTEMKSNHTYAIFFYDYGKFSVFNQNFSTGEEMLSVASKLLSQNKRVPEKVKAVVNGLLGVCQINTVNKADAEKKIVAAYKELADSTSKKYLEEINLIKKYYHQINQNI